MDSVCADDQTLNNNSGQENHKINMESTEPTTSDAVNTNQEPQTYDDLFPSLPSAPTRSSGTSGTNTIGKYDFLLLLSLNN